jgi:ATP-dependent Clp protease adaptor protein ClpS
MPKRGSTKNKKKQFQVVVFSDEVNHFEHVQQCLIDFCGHNVYQAEQCTVIIHNNGQFAVFSGIKERCEEVHELFSLSGIISEIYEVV